MPIPQYSPLHTTLSLQSTTGLASLPPEILKEIMSYLTSSPDLERIVLRPSRDACFQLQNFLKFLLQACRYLRAFALPLAWERFEVCASDIRTGMVHRNRDIARRNKELSIEISRQLEVITILNPDLSKHVKVVRVAMPVVEPLLAEKFARSLAFLPNLTTINVRLLGIHKVGLWASAFRDVSIPSVQTVQAPISIMPIFKACPNVKVAHISNFFMYIAHRTRNPLSNVFKCCPGSIEEFGNFTEWFSHDIKQFVKLWPRTKVLNLQYCHKLDFPKQLSEDRAISEFKKLPELICVRIWCQTRDFDMFSRRDQASISFARRILAFNPPPPGEHKCIILLTLEVDKKKHIVVSDDTEEDLACPHFSVEREAAEEIRYFDEKSSVPELQ